MKIREKALESLRIKGAFGAQELYDKHRGKKETWQYSSMSQAKKVMNMNWNITLYIYLSFMCSSHHIRIC